MLDQVCVGKYWHGSSVGIKKKQKKRQKLKNGGLRYSFLRIERLYVVARQTGSFFRLDYINVTRIF
jgi:hypothetical protein